MTLDAATERNLMPGSVLIRVPNWVGDAVMSVPALRAFRRIFLRSKVTLLARPSVAGLFEDEGLADDTILLSEAGGPIRRFLSDAGSIYRRRFELALLLPNSIGAALLARAGGVKRLAGYPTDGRGVLLDCAVPFETDYRARHQVRYYSNIAAHIEESMTGSTQIDLDAQPELHIKDEQVRGAIELLENCGVNPSRPLLAVNPGATNSDAKRWLVERFAEAADRLHASEGLQPVIVGTSSDRSIAEEVAATMRTRPAILAGRTTITQVKALLSCCSLLISNDTGAAHIAAALQVPTVVIFGPTEHHSTRPMSDKAAIVRRDVECSPCMLRTCPIDHRCMTRVTVDDVLQTTKALLGSDC